MSYLVVSVVPMPMCVPVVAISVAVVKSVTVNPMIVHISIAMIIVLMRSRVYISIVNCASCRVKIMYFCEVWWLVFCMLECMKWDLIAHLLSNENLRKGKTN